MLESTIEKSLGIQIKTKAVKKLGPKTYLIELTSIEDKIKIMKNKSKLKEYTEEKVYINDDMTKEEREIQEKIRRKAKEERMKGKTVKIGFQNKEVVLRVLRSKNKKSLAPVSISADLTVKQREYLKKLRTELREINEQGHNKTISLTVFYQNVRGLRTKLQDVYLESHNLNYDVIILTETWLLDSIPSSELFCPSYSVYRRDRDSSTSLKQRGGGVLIAVRSDYPSSLIKLPSNFCEEIYVSLLIENKEYVFGGVYLPPDSGLDVYHHHVSSVDVYRRDRDSSTSLKQRGGGVLIAVRSDYPSSLIKLPSNFCEEIYVSLLIENKEYVFGGVYLPPDSGLDVYHHHVSSVDYLLTRCPNSAFCIAGDYNMPGISWQNGDAGLLPVSSGAAPWESEVCDSLTFLGLLQLNNILNHNSVVLDLD
ncbi:hypothetical protein QE152_g331 [Popillia japonica]|uniref:Endonuclease/exonuclease/phosphatase domain-containing protein n=1 Tax=Popillia japonica TaxID=7064 RepID=A0AAW1NK69_POPJA